MQIPYAKQWIDEEDIAYVSEVLRGDWLTQGPTIDLFEEEIARYTDSKYCVAFNSGTAALHAAMFAAGVQEGDEVITAPVTFVATSNSAIYLRARPVFVDIDWKTYCIDVSKIESAITEKTRVIAPIDYAGYPVNIEPILEMAHKKGIVVVEDAAHALGAKRNGKPVGSQSDMTMFSFHPVKHITTGEGGVITTNSEDYYKKMKIFRTHGITKDPGLLVCKDEGPWYYEMQCLGYNYRITDFQCALGISQLKKLPDSLQRRNQIALKYHRAFRSFPEMILPPLPEESNSSHAYHLFPVLFTGKERKHVFTELKKKGIHAQVHYLPVHLQPYYVNNFGFKKGDFPVSEAFYEKEISIPMFPALSDSEIEYVIEVICGLYR